MEMLPKAASGKICPCWCEGKGSTTIVFSVCEVAPSLSHRSLDVEVNAREEGYNRGGKRQGYSKRIILYSSRSTTEKELMTARPAIIAITPRTAIAGTGRSRIVILSFHLVSLLDDRYCFPLSPPPHQLRRRPHLLICKFCSRPLFPRVPSQTLGLSIILHPAHLTSYLLTCMKPRIRQGTSPCVVEGETVYQTQCAFDAYEASLYRAVYTLQH